LFDAAFEAILGVRHVFKVLIVSAEPEPCSCVGCVRGCFKVLEYGSGVLSNTVWIGGTCGKGGSEVDGLCNVGRGTLWGRLRGRDLEDEGDGDLGEMKESWVRDGDGTGRDASCYDLLEAIYKEEDITTPGGFENGVMGRMLDAGKCSSEICDGGQGCSQGRRRRWRRCFLSRAVSGRNMGRGLLRWRWMGVVEGKIC